MEPIRPEIISLIDAGLDLSDALLDRIEREGKPDIETARRLATTRRTLQRCRSHLGREGLPREKCVVWGLAQDDRLAGKAPAPEVESNPHLGLERWYVQKAEARKLGVEPHQVRIAFAEGSTEIIGGPEVAPCQCDDCAPASFAEELALAAFRHATEHVG